jgi:hypothetical protein
MKKKGRGLKRLALHSQRYFSSYFMPKVAEIMIARAGLFRP